MSKERQREINGLEIDQNRLDEEWNDQPILYARYATRAADARKAHDEAKSRLEVVKAELDREIRKNPKSYGIEKITETQVTSTILLQAKYQEFSQEVIDKHHEMDVINAFVNALDQRRSALGKMVDLFLADYFSKPNASGDAREYTREVEKKSARGKVKMRDLAPRGD